MIGKVKSILATDCGSTTSKARFFKKIGDEYRFVVAGEAPTTVEAPYEDVTLGVRNAVREVEELTGHKLLSPNGIITPQVNDSEGVDVYVTTSSAGGGLQMMVSGVIRTMTAESAERAALGAGAIVMDVIAADDGREDYQKIERIRFLRPDMILSAGGTDGGNIYHVVQTAEFLAAADPKPRLGSDFKLPVLFAGNTGAQKQIEKLLGEKFSLKMTENIRPTLEFENAGPARDAVHELFMEHVMSHAPGYNNLMKWTPTPIMPTPMGEGRMFQVYAETRKLNAIGVGLGGATTNVYSIYDGKFVRSVSANLGMSYSICNVLKEAGIENIVRWLPFEADETDIINRLYNKMIRPTTIPQTLEELLVEHAVAREALRLGFQHHKFLARPLIGRVRKGSLVMGLDSDIATGYASYIDNLRVDGVGGTGGLLSHAPRRVQSMLILSDGFGVEGVTRLFQDSVFMMPHLGVLSTVHREIAMEIYDKDCLVRLGTSIALKGHLGEDSERKVATITIKMPDGETLVEEPTYGSIKKIPLKDGDVAQVEINPARGFDVGSGSGRRLRTSIEGGVIGILIDARGRPITMSKTFEERSRKLLEWFTALEAYPEIKAR